MNETMPVLAMTRSHRTFLTTVLALLGFASFAQAAGTNFVWNNGAGTDFTTAGNWTPVTAYPGSNPTTGVGDIATFNDAEVSDPNLSKSDTFGEITFSTTSASGYTLTSSNTSTFFNLDGVAASGNDYIVVAANTSGTNTISAPINFTNTLNNYITQTAGGTLVLSGTISTSGSPGPLILTPNGTIAMTGSNSYSVNTEITGGTGILEITSLSENGSNGSLGTGTIISGFNVNNGAIPVIDYMGGGGTYNQTIELDSTSAATTAISTISTAGETGALTLSGSITGIAGSGATPAIQFISNNTLGDTVSGTISNGTNKVTSVYKTGIGNWTFSGDNTYTGTTLVGGGELILSYSSTAANTVLSSGDAVQFGAEFYQPGTRTIISSVAGSDTLLLDGAAGTSNVQTLGAITLSVGASHLDISPGAGGGFALTLGAVPTGLDTGATLDINIPTGATVTTTTASATITSSTSGLFATPITVDGDDWATNQGSAANPIVGLSTITGAYSTETTVGANSSKAIDIQAGTTSVTGNFTAPAIRFNNASASTISITSGDSFGLTQGILMTSNVGGTDVITGGAIEESGSSVRGLSIIQNNTSQYLEIDSVVANSIVTQSVEKSGAGTVLSTAANTFTGNLYVNEGTWEITNAAGLGGGEALNSVINGVTGTGVAEVGTGAVIDLHAAASTTMTVDKPIDLYNGGSLVNNGSGTAVLDNGVAGVNITNTGTGTATGASISISGSGGATATAVVNTKGQITSETLTNPGTGYTSAPTVTITTSGGTENTAPTAIATLSSLTLDGTNNILGGSGNLTINAVINDGSSVDGNANNGSPGGYYKTGAGTLTLTGANLYTGATVIQAGTVALSTTASNNNIPYSNQILVGDTLADQAATLDVSAVTPSNGNGFQVQSGQTLAGYGFVTANTGGATTPISTLSGSTVSPGTTGTVGTLTITTANLTLNAGTKFLYDLNGVGSNDQLNVNGTLTLNGTQFSDFTFNTLTNVSPGDQYTLMVSNGAVAGTLGADTTGYVDGYMSSIDISGDDLLLEVASVPEPSTWTLLLGGVALLFVYHRWRRSAKRPDLVDVPPVPAPKKP